MRGPAHPDANDEQKHRVDREHQTGIARRRPRSPPAEPVDNRIGGDEHAGSQREKQREPIQPHAAAANQTHNPDAGHKHGNAHHARHADLFGGRGPCHNQGEKRRRTSGDGINLAEIASAIAPCQEQVIAGMQDARCNGIWQACRRRKGKHQQHGAAHDAHQALNQEQRQKPVELQLDHDVPGAMQHGGGKDGEKHCDVQG